jgi:hypothetical protein
MYCRNYLFCLKAPNFSGHESRILYFSNKRNLASATLVISLQACMLNKRTYMLDCELAQLTRIICLNSVSKGSENTEMVICFHICQDTRAMKS